MNKKIQQLTRVDEAFILQDVTKSYTLYGNISQAIADRLGLYKLRFWRDRPNFPVHKALNEINFTAVPGERIGVIGENGAGKTTLLKLLMQNFIPSSGTVVVNGSIQAIMQTGLGFDMNASGYENARSALIYNGFYGDELKLAIEDLIEFTELKEKFYQPVSTYSKGMIARLQFAAATALKPEIVIIDEVLGAGDAYFSIKSSARMKNLVSSGCTLLLVSHSMEQVVQFCDRVIWVANGKIEMDGRARDVISAYDDYMGKRSSEAGHAIVEKIPEYAEKKFIRNLILAQEPVDIDSEKEEKIGLESGSPGYRWSGTNAIQIKNLRFIVDNKEASQVKPGGACSIEIHTSSIAAGEYELCYVATVFRIDGLKVCEISNSCDSFVATAGERRVIQIEIDTVLIGSGEYLLSFGVYGKVANFSVESAIKNRHDFLSRSLYFKVLGTNDTEPPYLHQPGLWFFGHNTSGETRRIDGWI